MGCPPSMVPVRSGYRGHGGDEEAEVVAQLVNRDQTGLEAAGVEAGLDEQEIGAAFHETLGLRVVVAAELGEGGGAGDVEVLVGGPYRAGDEARFGSG